MEKQKIIGVDIDNTLFSCRSLLYNIAAKLKVPVSKRKLKYAEVPYCQDPKVNPLLKGIFKFFNPNKYQEFPEAVKSLNSLYDEGFEIHLLNSRPNINIFVTSVQEWLNNHGVKYHKLIVGCNDKPKYISENNVDILIDDLSKTCKEAEVVGSKSIIFRGSLKQKLQEGKPEKKLKYSNIATSWKSVLKKIKDIFAEKDVEQE